MSLEEGLKGFADMGEGGLEAFLLINFANPGLDARGLPKGEEKPVGGEADEELLAGEMRVVGLFEEHAAGVQRKHRIADPGKVLEVAFVHATG